MTSTLHLISDATGETVASIGAAAAALFPDRQLTKRLHVFIRSESDVDDVITRIRAEPGPVLITMLDAALRSRIIEAVEAEGLEAAPVLKPVIEMLERHLGEQATIIPGGQYAVNESYFRRVDAIDYAMGHDDGAGADRLSQADVILTGVSRTSKTPTCIFLACRGVKAANHPLVPGAEPPQGFLRAAQAGVPVIGLTASPNRLAQIRSHRLEAIGHETGADYAALDQIRQEVAEARLLFDRLGAPVIDVTRRSIEETAAAVMAILREKGRA